MRGRLLLAALAGAGLSPSVRRFDASAGLCARRPCRREPTPILAALIPPISNDTSPSRRRYRPALGRDAPAPADRAEPAATSPEPTPIVASIRAKLQDPTLARNANAQDLAALTAFYDARSDPIWMTDMGFSSEAQSAIDEVLRADDWGLSSADFQLPPAGDLPNSVDDQALNEIKLDLAILKYARYARGGRTVPVQLSKLYGMTPSLRDPKTVLTEIADAPEPSVYLQGLHPKHVQFQRLHQALLKARAESEAGAKPANLQKIVVNMERWRWMPENLGSLHILLNVPAFMVYVARDGKGRSTRTRSLSAN